MASLSNISDVTAKGAPHRATHTKKSRFFRFEKLDKDVAFAVYDQPRHGGLKPLTNVPAFGQASYVYMFYDEQKNAFVNPLSVTPSLDAAKVYTLKSTLHSFNMKASDWNSYKNLSNDVQLSINAATPNPIGELTWIFMNALRIFSQPNQGGGPATLTTFNGQAGTALSTQPTVTVTKGQVTLQITAYGQKQKGIWDQFIDGVVSIFGNDGTATAVLSGFGIPALAADAVKFVAQALQTLEDSENLVALWETGGIEFGLDPKTTERFKMCPGLWTVIDHDYWITSGGTLQGHTIDTAGQTFAVLDSNKRPVDANYFVTEFGFTEVPQ